MGTVESQRMKTTAVFRVVKEKGGATGFIGFTRFGSVRFGPTSKMELKRLSKGHLGPAASLALDPIA